MDSLFDEDQDEVGSEIEAYCPSARCKADTNHTIISMYEDEVRRVQCAVCSDVHAYRKPKGEADAQESGAPRGRLRKKPSWEEAMAQVTEQELSACRPYSILDTYETLDVVSHPKFGVGFVTELLSDNKVEITFKDERRVLVHNRSDLANRMPDIADAPPPRDQKKRRRRKGPTSELAARLRQERAQAGVKSKDFAEKALAKRLSAERAAQAKRRAASGEDVIEAERLAAEKAKERERLQKQKEREKLEKQKEREKLKKQKERDRERAQKERERERAKKQKERERERAQKERERERAKKVRERERAQKERERERAKKERERLRRTGGKKSVPAISRKAKKPTKKPSKPVKKTPKRRPAARKPAKRRR